MRLLFFRGPNSSTVGVRLLFLRGPPLEGAHTRKKKLSKTGKRSPLNLMAEVYILFIVYNNIAVILQSKNDLHSVEVALTVGSATHYH